MKLNGLLGNIKSIKTQKVPGKDEWEVFGLMHGGKGRLVASFQSKDEADEFKEMQITREEWHG